MDTTAMKIIFWTFVILLGLIVMFFINREDNEVFDKKMADAEKLWAEKKAFVAKNNPDYTEEQIGSAAIYVTFDADKEYERHITNKYNTPSYDSYERSRRNDSDFVDSAIIGAVTDSTILGAVIGGSVGGAMVGDVFFGDEDSDNSLWD